MADDSKKKQKGKHEAKEQRRKRQARQPADSAEKKQEKEPETPIATGPEKPAYQPPGPEFYKGLKRETDEILKISEQENSKYKNKEIQSNWAKYEMPIESYEEMDEQEQLGADYETLIQAPLSVGTHFQFKHEKSWDVTSGPSPYQKYFDIDMGNLIVALSTIPFYERNSVDKSIFTDSDFLSMDHRATKYKQKYYSDSKYNKNELEAQNKNSESVKAVNSDKHTERSDEINGQLFKFKNINLEACHTVPLPNKLQNLVLDVTEPSTIECYDSTINMQNDPVITNNKNIMDKRLESPEMKLVDKGSVSVPIVISEESTEVTHSQKEPSKSIIESPEDLEKWLEDFLDN